MSTHGVAADLEPFRTVEDAIGDLGEPTPCGYVRCKDGQKTYNHKITPWHELSAEDMQNVKAVPRDLVTTIIRSTKLRHYDERKGRRLTDREKADLFSFPRNYQLFEPTIHGTTRLSVYLANAVPVGMATAVAKRMKEVLDLGPKQS